MSQIERLFSSRGVSQIYVKFLAPKQDNDKNQIYLGSGLNGIVNLFPARLDLRSASESTRKRKSKKGDAKLEAHLDFEWLDEHGSSYTAPNTKIIDYFQYPEVRLSGFLENCENGPECLRRTKNGVENLSRYGQRLLILGSNNKGKTYGLTINALEDPIINSFPELAQCETVTVFKTHIIGATTGSNPEELLLQELKSLSGLWHASSSLKIENDDPVPFKGNQGAGYTLEALLNIPRNSSKSPDKHGFEIKSFKRSGKISLMTPTADRGQEADLGFKEFMSQYGWSGQKGDGRQVFNGIHKYHLQNKRTGYILDVLGYEASDMMSAVNQESIIVGLMDRGSLISGWSFQKLLNSWCQKHASACYVEYQKRPYSGQDKDHDYEYFYTGKVIIGKGTTIFNYLNSITSGTVYYDPAHEIKFMKNHVRPQWRISVTKQLPSQLTSLYNNVYAIDEIRSARPTETR